MNYSYGIHSVVNFASFNLGVLTKAFIITQVTLFFWDPYNRLTLTNLNTLKILGGNMGKNINGQLYPPAHQPTRDDPEV